MKAKYFYVSAVVVVTLALPLNGAPLTESTFTEVIKEVNVVDASTHTATPAMDNTVLQAPNRCRTGPESRAELTAPDQTITRIGANSVFSFEGDGRTLELEQGNVLFHAPKGIGGGTIKSGGAIAAVLGTTLAVSSTPDGGFKVILLEGTGKVTMPNGKSVSLHAGQMVFVLPHGGGMSDVLTINLGKLVDGSSLVNGFSHPLSSLPLIQAAVDQQNKMLANGQASDTGESPENATDGKSKQLKPVDIGSYQAGDHPTLSATQLVSLPPGKGFGGRQTVPVGPP